MTLSWNSLDEIFESLVTTRRSTLALLGGFSGEQTAFRPDGDAWSIAEIAEHISLSEDRILAGIKRALSQVESVGASKDPKSETSVSLEEIGRQAQGRKFKSPEASTPQAGATIAASIQRMQITRDELSNLRNRIEAADLSSATFPHPAFGPLNAYEWLAFMIKHEERHVAQMKNVMSSPRFPGAG